MTDDPRSLPAPSTRVLLVDDAAFMRRSLAKLLSDEPSVEIIGEAVNGAEAVEMCQRLRPDVVCLDIDMPMMNGIIALKHIMAVSPRPVVVVSSMTDRDHIPFEALRLGAIDFFPKPSTLSGGLERQARHLLYLIRNAHRIRRDNLHRVRVRPLEDPAEGRHRPRHLIAVGGTLGSVGGLIQLLSNLPPRHEIGLTIVFQAPIHRAITASFLESLQGFFGWNVVEAGAEVEPLSGRAVFIAPEQRVSIDRDRPEVLRLEAQGDDDGSSSLDSLFEWVSDCTELQATAILLAGDRPDGIDGLAAAHQAGARCFIQDETSALFSSWQPGLGQSIPTFDISAIAASVRSRLASQEELP